MFSMRCELMIIVTRPCSRIVKSSKVVSRHHEIASRRILKNLWYDKTVDCLYRISPSPTTSRFSQPIKSSSERNLNYVRHRIVFTHYCKLFIFNRKNPIRPTWNASSYFIILKSRTQEPHLLTYAHKKKKLN